MKLALVISMLPLLGACRTVATREVSNQPPVTVRVGQRARSWEVRQGDERVGLVMLFQDRGRIGDSLYIVRNNWNQDLGLIDGLGRAYRYLPHHKEPAWIGSGTIALGAERILGLDRSCALVEFDVEAQAAPAELAEQRPAENSVEPRENAPTPASSPAAPDEGLPQSL